LRGDIDVLRGQINVSCCMIFFWTDVVWFWTCGDVYSYLL
jgi:hypothetical protein